MRDSVVVMRAGPEHARVPPILARGMLALLAVTAVASCSSPRPSLPNVVVIVVDTLRADHLPFYGYDGDTAPFLTRLASRGLVFERAWSTSSWTAPATASIFTSLYPFQHGVLLGFESTGDLQEQDATIILNRIPVELETLPEVMRAAGYRTYGVADNLNICPEMGFDAGFDRFRTMRYEGAEAVNEQVYEWEREMGAADGYFLYVHYMDPHGPYNHHGDAPGPAGDARARELARYDGEIRHVDAHIRELFERLGWDRRTLVVVTADHGEEFQDHGQTGHGKNLYSETLRVPLLLYGQGLDIAAGRVGVDVSLIDILPTLRAWAGLQPDVRYEGADLLALARGDGGDRYLFGHLARRRSTVDINDDLLTTSVLDGRWKYIWTYDSGQDVTEELYDLEADPAETTNLWRDGDPVGMALRAQRAAMSKNYRSYRAGRTMFPVDEELRAELRSLGYMQ